MKATKIVCVGRNYVEHAKELGNEVPERPLLFLKPPSSIVGDGGAIVLPRDSSRIEHEAELAVVIGRQARDVPEEAALDYVGGLAPLNDVTARDLQRSDGQWTRAKGFDTFCPIGDPVAFNGREIPQLDVICRVNGEERQRGHTGQMVYSVPFLIAYISRIMTLEPGDVIATGTPAGVGPLVAGDVVVVEIPGVGRLSNPVVSA